MNRLPQAHRPRASARRSVAGGPAMNVAFTVVAGVAGVALGAGVGWLNVLLERLERLREEEDAERVEYEAEAATQAEAARARGEQPEPVQPWLPERYGWTWLEWGAAPVLGAVSFTLFAAHQGLTWLTIENLLWMAVFVHIVTFDLKHRLILDWVTYPAIVLALALAAVTPGLSLVRALTGGAVIGLFFLVFHFVSRRGIGLGDVKLGALIGAVTGLGLRQPRPPPGDLRRDRRGLPGRRGRAAAPDHPAAQPQGPDPLRSLPLRRRGAGPVPEPCR